MTMMPLTQSITLSLPEPTLRKLRRAAELTYRSVDELVTAAVNASLIGADTERNIPQELADELAAMSVLSDQALWAASELSLSAAQQRRLRQLNALPQTQALTEAEVQEQAALLNSYQRAVLRRAKALSILAQRGHAITAETLEAHA
jgi:uncharacterized protein YnzC (UPF0291/DUF896 family)